jgi:ATP-dependent Zn protease
MTASRLRLTVLLTIAAVFVLAMVWSYVVNDGAQADHAYSELLAKASTGDVVSISQDDKQLSVTVAGQAEPWIFNVATESVNVYAEVCAAAGAELGNCPIAYRAVAPSSSGSIVTLLITSLLPVLLIGSFIFFMMRQQQRKVG